MNPSVHVPAVCCCPAGTLLDTDGWLWWCLRRVVWFDCDSIYSCTSLPPWSPVMSRPLVAAEAGQPISPSLAGNSSPPSPPILQHFASLHMCGEKSDATNGPVMFDPYWKPPLPPIVESGGKIGGAPAGPANSSYTFATEDGRKITLSSMFCSGNMAKAEQHSDNHYHVWTAPDAANTQFQTGYRTWFHFSVRGARKGNTIKFTVMNMNKQTGLFQFDHRPVFTSVPSSRKVWTRLPVPVNSFQVQEGNIFEVEFKHTFVNDDPEVRFAFCFPYSYHEVNERLEYLEKAFSGEEVPLSDEPIPGVLALQKAAAEKAGSAGEIDTKKLPPKKLRGSTTVSRKVSTEGIYYHRELLGRSLDGRRVDIITITSSEGITSRSEREGPVEGYFPEVKTGNRAAARGSGGDGCRAHAFKSKKVVFFSARVHPGETPAQYVLEGIIRFLLRDGRRDPRAAALRDNFVFKIIPILNPDGVSRGHYRADTRGVNLNRMYQTPSRQFEPTIHMSKTMVMHYFAQDRLQLYMDLHAHASKRGVFIYGNRCDGLENQIENMLYVRLMTINTKWLDFDACNFSEKNMKSKDRRDDGASKEGSGRVAIYHATNNTFPHSYTLECNYNTGRSINSIPEAMNDRGRASPPQNGRQACPKYTDEAFMDVGQGALLALLDLKGINPWSRLHRSLWHNLDQARNGLFKRIRHSGPYREEAKTYADKLAKNKKQQKKAPLEEVGKDPAEKMKKARATKLSNAKKLKPKAVSQDYLRPKLRPKASVPEKKRDVDAPPISLPVYCPPSKIPAAVTNITWGSQGFGIVAPNHQPGEPKKGKPKTSSSIPGIKLSSVSADRLGPRAFNGLSYLHTPSDDEL